MTTCVIFCPRQKRTDLIKHQTCQRQRHCLMPVKKIRFAHCPGLCCCRIETSTASPREEVSNSRLPVAVSNASLSNIMLCYEFTPYCKASEEVGTGREVNRSV